MKKPQKIIPACLHFRKIVINVYYSKSNSTHKSAIVCFIREYLNISHTELVWNV